MRDSPSMNCHEMRALVADFAAERLAPEAHTRVVAHIEICTACRRATEIERALSAAIDRLPPHRAPVALRRRLEALVNSTAPATEGVDRDARTDGASRFTPGGRVRAMVSAAVASFVGACAAAALVWIVARPVGPTASFDLLTEAVNDHLRVVGSTHPVEIESGGIHQVKPWFTGRLDFAPRMSFSGDDEFPLVGGSVGYFHDRKAAVFSFKHRLHAITLLVFPADGLSWPGTGVRLGNLSIVEESARGFSILFWRDEGFGYALVSDVNRRDLETLATRLNTAL